VQVVAGSNPVAPTMRGPESTIPGPSLFPPRLSTRGDFAFLTLARASVQGAAMGRLLAITLLAALGAGCVAPQASWRAPGRSKAAAPPPSQTAPTPTQVSKSAERV